MTVPSTPVTPIETDALIVGAGPAGLFQVFELGLLGIKSHIVDTLKHPGGQCAELYPDKPIYDIPALPVCGAQELVDRLMQQIAPMGPVFHFGEEVAELQRQDDGRFFLRTAAGTEFLARNSVPADVRRKNRPPSCFCSSATSSPKWNTGPIGAICSIRRSTSSCAPQIGSAGMS